MLTICFSYFQKKIVKLSQLGLQNQHNVDQVSIFIYLFIIDQDSNNYLNNTCSLRPLFKTNSWHQFERTHWSQSFFFFHTLAQAYSTDPI
jgi:hypothetical protein